MMSWMMSIVIFPFIAVPLYFLIGIRKREKKHQKEYVQFHKNSIHNDYAVKDYDDAFQNLFEKNGIPAATKGNTLVLITSGTQAYYAMMKEIDNAKESIDICTYVFEFDETTKEILSALSAKAREGVRVHLLMDLVGSFRAFLNRKGFKELKEAGGEVAFFTPILKRPFLNYINLRNHRKIYLFDQNTLLSGGMNLSNEYMGKEQNTKRWEDLLYYLKGPAVYSFCSIFHNDWVYATKEEKKNDLKEHEVYHGQSLVQVVPSGPDIKTDALYEALLNAIYNAKKRIWIVAPYFVPDDNIMQALVIAQHKGVDVKLITPRNSDSFLVDSVRNPYIRELYDVGADVILYESGMLHAKAILFDSAGGMVGTVNFDNRSLFLNYEVVSFVYSSEFIESLEIWMESLMREGTRGIKHPSKLREAFENMMKVFTPLL